VSICRDPGRVAYLTGIAPFNNAIIAAPPLNATVDQIAELAAKLGDGLRVRKPCDEMIRTIPRKSRSRKSCQS